MVTRDQFGQTTYIALTDSVSRGLIEEVIE